MQYSRAFSMDSNTAGKRKNSELSSSPENCHNSGEGVPPSPNILREI